MALKSLRRFDVQAKVSLIISILGGLGAVGLIALLIRNYKPYLGAVEYKRDGMYATVFLLSTAATMLLSAIGLVMGFNSAGQRRNNMQGRSWAAFFLGAAVLAGAFICFAMFWVLRMPMN